MTDTPERYPTRTEDVEEALEALEQLRGMVREDAELLGDPDGYEGTICDVLCALRSRLEEVEEERDRWRAEFDKASDNLAAVCEELGNARRRAEESEEDAARYADSNMKLNAGYNRLARRADRLEEAGQNVLDERDEHPHRDLSDSREIEGLRIALDSREDEGEECTCVVDAFGGYMDPECPKHSCTCESVVAERGAPEERYTYRDPDCPVHADEPEGDERTTKRKEICECGHPKWMHSIGGRTGPRGRCAENVCVCTEYRRDPSPTDEPVSREGEGEERLYVIVKGAGPDVQFVEIENHVGKSVSVPRRPAEGDGYSRIGPLYRRPAPTDEPESGEGVEYEEVDRFAALMRDRLYVNRHRGKSWKDETDEWLLTRLRDELRELEEALPGRGFTTEQERKAIANEAADVANFAMMIADNVLRHSGGDGLERPTHADARSKVPEPDAEDVRQMSDEELVEGLESLAISFCQEAGFGYMPVKLHALEIKRRLSDRHEDEGERETPMNDRPTFADGEIDRLARIGAAVLERVDENGYVTYEMTRSGEQVGICPACTSAAGTQHNADKMHFAGCPIAARLGLTARHEDEGEG